MQNNHIVQAIAQSTPPWFAFIVGHVSSSITLSNLALLSSTVYSLVSIWSHFRKKK